MLKPSVYWPLIAAGTVLYFWALAHSERADRPPSQIEKWQAACDTILDRFADVPQSRLTVSEMELVNACRPSHGAK